MEKEDVLKIDEELQRLAFNLADTLDTLNYHSIGETVADLRKNVFSMSMPLRSHIQYLHKNKDRLLEIFPELQMDKMEADLDEMDALLDVVNRCTGEAGNYRGFVDTLIPLLDMCNRWGGQGPLSEAGAF